MAKSAAMKVLKTSMKASQTSMKAVKAMKANQKTSSSPMKSMKVLPSSPMKSMKVKKDSGNKDKNKDKGAKGKKLSLEEKIQLWREKNKDAASDAEEEPDLSHEEWQKVNGRFKTAMNKIKLQKMLGRCQQPEQRQCAEGQKTGYGSLVDGPIIWERLSAIHPNCQL